MTYFAPLSAMRSDELVWSDVLTSPKASRALCQGGGGPRPPLASQDTLDVVELGVRGGVGFGGPTGWGSGAHAESVNGAKQNLLPLHRRSLQPF